MGDRNIQKEGTRFLNVQAGIALLGCFGVQALIFHQKPYPQQLISARYCHLADCISWHRVRYRDPRFNTE